MRFFSIYWKRSYDNTIEKHENIEIQLGDFAVEFSVCNRNDTGNLMFSS